MSKEPRSMFQLQGVWRMSFVSVICGVTAALAISAAMQQRFSLAEWSGLIALVAGLEYFRLARRGWRLPPLHQNSRREAGIVAMEFTLVFVGVIAILLVLSAPPVSLPIEGMPSVTTARMVYGPRQIPVWDSRPPGIGDKATPAEINEYYSTRYNPKPEP